MNLALKALIILHTESEGPGSLGEFMASKGATVNTVRLYSGEELPRYIRDFNAVISMGGPMNVYEDNKYPFLAAEAVFLKDAIGAGMAVLGVCLGAQMIARSCNAAVKKAPENEIGWSKVELTDEGRRDDLFLGVPRVFPVLQWHEDTFDLPENATLLAIAPKCPHQAFRYKNAYGIQFHIEATREMLSDWFDGTAIHDNILITYEEMEKEISRNAERIYTNFVALAD